MSFKEYVEIVSNIAQPLLVVLGCFVFAQIKLAKDDLRTRSKREAATAAAELAERYRKEILTAQSEYYKLVRSKNFSVTGINLESLSIKDFYTEEVQDLSTEHKQYNNDLLAFFQSNRDAFNACQDVLNSLESFAINFTKGIADQEIVFTAISKSYCQFVERSFPMLCFLRHKDQFNFYENVVELYCEWSNMIKATGLTFKKNSINGELDKINTGKRLNAPIGTK
jgi:hypothetical protein